MRDKRMTELTGRQMVIHIDRNGRPVGRYAVVRISGTVKYVVGRAVSYKDAVHDARIYDAHNDKDARLLEFLLRERTDQPLIAQSPDIVGRYDFLARCSGVLREGYKQIIAADDAVLTVYRLWCSRAGYRLCTVFSGKLEVTRAVAMVMGWPYVRGKFIMVSERVDILAEVRAFLNEKTVLLPLEKIPLPLMNMDEMQWLHDALLFMMDVNGVRPLPTATGMVVNPTYYTAKLPSIVIDNVGKVRADVKQLLRMPHIDYAADGSVVIMAADNHAKAQENVFSEVRVGRLLRKIFPHATQAVITRMVEKFNADNKGYKLELTKTTEEMCRIMREGAQMSSAAFPHTCMTTICLSIYDKEDYLPEWVHPYMAYDHELGWAMAMIKDDKGFVVGRAIVHTERMEFVRVFANGNNVASSTFEKILTLAGYKQVSGWYGLLLKRVPLSLERIDDMMTESIAAVVPYLDGEDSCVEPAGEFLRITNKHGNTPHAGYCEANGWTIVEPVRCERCGGEDIRAMRVIVGEGVTQRWGWCCSYEMRRLPDRKYYDASILVEDEQQRNQYIPRWEWKRYNAQQVVELDDVTMEQCAGQSHTPSPVMHGFLRECRGRLTQAEYNSVARLVDTLTPAGDWLFTGHYTELRRRLGRIDDNNNLVYEMRVVLATMRGDGWQDYNTVAREETSLPAAIERLTNSTPISPMYGTRERPITLAYAEGYTLRGGTL